MANIGKFKIHKTGWVKLEDVIKERISDFAFKSGTAYLFQPNHFCRICIKAATPTDPKEGFDLASKEKVTYTHVEGTTLYIDSVDGELYVNISE